MRPTAPHKRGTRNPNARLDEAAVRQILSSPRSNRSLARELGVSHVAVSNVRSGRTWAWLRATPGAEADA
ncbi:MAG: hypothetical protein H6711_34160 [Myxococcales bacterium]|nr:hypothetical protein [Myxococcales bacterium]